MNANSQAQHGCVGHAGGVLNYKNAKDGPPPTSIEFNYGGGDKAGEEDEKVATANIAVNEVISGEGAEGAAEMRPRPPSLPAFGSSRVSNAAAAVVLSTSSRGSTSRNLQPAVRRSLSSMSYTSRERSKEKTKNSTNSKWGSISKALDRIAQSLKSGGGRNESNMMMLMLSMQMQQMAQQLLMQQQMFQQQMQMQMSAMEKRVDNCKKYLWRIALSLTSHNHKHKRGGTDDEDNYSSNDDKQLCNLSLIENLDHPMLVVPYMYCHLLLCHQKSPQSTLLHPQSCSYAATSAAVLPPSYCHCH
jgi:hypothetical protein